MWESVLDTVKTLPAHLVFLIWLMTTWSAEMHFLVKSIGGVEYGLVCTCLNGSLCSGVRICFVVQQIFSTY